jgi:cytochrome c oxidase subunit II
MPPDVSAHGYRIDALINITLVFVTILFVIMCAWMAYSCLRHGRSHRARYDRASRRGIAVVLGFAGAVFFVVDGNLFVTSTLELKRIFWNFADADRAPDTVRIEINAHQWAWDARYAGNDGTFNTPDDVVTLNDIRVPVDAVVLLQLASVDVLHSFYLPNFRVKQDVVPGSINRLRFASRKLGVYEVGCAQHCGANHYKMRGELTVMPPAEFAVWLKEQSDEAVRVHEEALRNGFTPQMIERQWGWSWSENL